MEQEKPTKELSNIGCLIEGSNRSYMSYRTDYNTECRQGHKHLEYTSVFFRRVIRLCQFTTCMVIHFLKSGSDKIYLSCQRGK